MKKKQGKYQQTPKVLWECFVVLSSMYLKVSFTASRMIYEASMRTDWVLDWKVKSHASHCREILWLTWKSLCDSIAMRLQSFNPYNSAYCSDSGAWKKSFAVFKKKKTLLEKNLISSILECYQILVAIFFIIIPNKDSKWQFVHWMTMLWKISWLL